MDAEECAKKVIKKSLEVDGTIDDDALMEVVARVCGKATSVSLSAASAASASARSMSSGRLSSRKMSMDIPRRPPASLRGRSASMEAPREGIEHRTSRPKSAKAAEQALFEGLRRQVADAITVSELEETIDRIEAALDDGAVRIPRETSRLEGLIKKADNRLNKDPNLKE